MEGSALIVILRKAFRHGPGKLKNPFTIPRRVGAATSFFPGNAAFRRPGAPLSGRGRDILLSTDRHINMDPFRSHVRRNAGRPTCRGNGTPDMKGMANRQPNPPAISALGTGTPSPAPAEPPRERRPPPRTAGNRTGQRSSLQRLTAMHGDFVPGLSGGGTRESPRRLRARLPVTSIAYANGNQDTSPLGVSHK